MLNKDVTKMMIKRDSSDDLEIRISIKRPSSGAGERDLRDGEKNGAKLGRKYSGWSFHKRWLWKRFLPLYLTFLTLCWQAKANI